MKTIRNILWFLLSGLWMALAHVVFCVIGCVRIIGILFGIAKFKMIPVSLVPLGRHIVRIGQPYGPPSAPGYT